MEPAIHFMLKLIHMNWTTLDEFCKLHLSLSAGAERAGLSRPVSRLCQEKHGFEVIAPLREMQAAFPA